MNASEIPMILFTVIAQMCVGAFIILGIVQLCASGKYSNKTIDRVSDSAVLLIGPALVIGLIASMFHMNDVFHVFNVFRHLGTSWLSREVTFGVLFAAFGFLFALIQWFKIGSVLLRRVVALITAVLGVCLVWSMAKIYLTLRAVPAWNSWGTPVQFAGTTILLGGLLVAAALLLVRSITVKEEGQGSAVEGYEPGKGLFAEMLIGAPSNATSRKWYQRVTDGVESEEDQAKVDQLVASAVRCCILITVIGAVILLVALPFFLATLASKGGPAAVSAAVYSHGSGAIRLILLAVGAVLLAVVGYSRAVRVAQRDAFLNLSVFLAFVMIFTGEILGRFLFYEMMARVGI